MTKPTRPLLISYGLFGLALACFIAAIAMDPTIHGIRGLDALRASETSQTVKSNDEPTQAPAAQEAVQDAASEPSSTPSSTSAPATVKDQAAAPRSASGAEVPEQGAHIPFTQQPVTPGDPESYVDTVGQCPFYEMAGPKGCTPPPDIECNADWSVCGPRTQ